MKRLLLTIAAAVAFAVAAMPTREELKNAVPIVGELMNPLVADFKAKKKTAVEVGDAAMAYAKEANTEAAKFLLLKGAIWYYAQAKEDSKAVAAIDAIDGEVKNLPPEVMRNDVLKPAIDHVSEQNVPGLFAQFRSASARMEIAKLASSVKRNQADEPTRRRYAELLTVTGDWKAALDVFAKLKDAKTAQAAKDEIAGKALSAAGDFWWDYKPTEDTAADTVKNHAVALYRSAIDSGELTGLKKVVAEKRIASVPFADRFTVSNAANVSRGSDTPAASATPNGKYKFNYKLDDKGNAILCGAPCVSPKPEGVLVVPDKIDGHMVTKIDNVAFKDCDKMTRIVLPSYLQDILVQKKGYPNNPGAIFAGCSALESIEISKVNRDYTSENGVLYTKDKKNLVAYPKTRSQITLARETTRVGESAFHSCTFKTAKIPDSVDRFGCCAFSQCPNLEVVEFPKIVDKISAYAFEGSPNMKKVVFHGDAPARLSDGRVNLFVRSSKDIVVEVKKGSKGWKADGSTELPERWPTTGSNSRPIRYKGTVPATPTTTTTTPRGDVPANTLYRRPLGGADRQQISCQMA